MIDIVKNDVTTLPGFTDPDSGDLFWPDVLLSVNQVNLSCDDTDQDRRMARIYLAAHILTKSYDASSGAAGPLTAESVGGIRRSYGLIASSSTSASLASTGYGQQYLDILASSLVGAPSVL